VFYKNIFKQIDFKEELTHYGFNLVLLFK